MRIVAKSIIETRELQDKKRKGGEYFELHLLPKDVLTEEAVNKGYAVLQENDVCVLVVHTPIERRYSLESLNTESGYIAIANTCLLASKLSKKQGQDVHVVLHFELSAEQVHMWGYYEKIRARIESLLLTYPGVQIDIENLALMCLDNGKLFFANNFSFDNIQLCKDLRADLRTTRVGTVLDTCHVLMSKRQVDHIDCLNIYPEYSIAKIIEESKECLHIVHLANAVGFGLNAQHGTGFYTPEDETVLKGILEDLQGVGYDGILTLEVQEADYLDSKVFGHLKSQVEDMWCDPK